MPSSASDVQAAEATETQPTQTKKAEKSGKAEVKCTNPNAKPDEGLWHGYKIPVVGVTGEKFSGKSIFASLIDPARTFYVDLEDSIASYSFPYKKSVSLYESLVNSGLANPKPTDVYKWFRKTVDEIKKGEYTVLAIDPISDLEAGMVQYVEDNPKEFGYTQGQFDKAPGLVWAAVKQHWKLLLGLLSAKVDTFVFTTHLGTVWADGRPVKGKSKPKGKDVLMELASLYLWLVREKDADGKLPEKPSARVIKSRLAVVPTNADGSIGAPLNILPPGIANCDPDAIRRYILTPPNWDKLKKHELAPEEKLVLNEDERLEMQREIVERQAEIAEKQLAAEKLRAETRKLRSEQEAAQAEARGELTSSESVAAPVKSEAKSEKAKPTDASTNAAIGEKQAAPFDEGSSAPAEKKVDPLLEDIQKNTDEVVRTDTLRQIVSVKKELGIQDAQWSQVMQKRGVSSAKELDTLQLTELLSQLNALLAKRKEKQKEGAASGN